MGSWEEKEKERDLNICRKAFNSFFFLNKTIIHPDKNKIRLRHAKYLDRATHTHTHTHTKGVHPVRSYFKPNCKPPYRWLENSLLFVINGTLFGCASGNRPRRTFQATGHKVRSSCGWCRWILIAAISSWRRRRYIAIAITSSRRRRRCIAIAIISSWYRRR